LPDWSETSRIATLWTRELGKVRVLAKGGRRLKSNFESALDLLTLCSIVLLRKSSGSLNLLTEAQVVGRYPQLRRDLPALYAGYYLAELLGDLTEEFDPHPQLFDEARETLQTLGTAGVSTGPRLAHFEMTLLRELGYLPGLDTCVGCSNALTGQRLAFSPALGGVVCETCQSRQRDRRALSPAAWHLLRELAEPGGTWRQAQDNRVRGEVRQLLNEYVTYLLGRRPRLLPYLGS
jgi:DNA repair protein RecO (recombination protein O)